MTNEEAREVINRQIDKAIDDEIYITEEVYDALCVASKSIALQILESQPSAVISKNDLESSWKPDFCPNCGADMRGDSDEVDN